MVRFSGFCALLLLCSWYQVCSGNYVEFAKMAVQAAVKLFQGIKMIQARGAANQAKSEQITFGEREIYKRLDRLSTDFQDLKTTIINKISNQLTDKITQNSNKLFIYIKDIQDLYEKFINYLRNRDKYEHGQKDSYINAITEGYSNLDLPTKVRRMHDALVDSDIREESLISLIAKDNAPTDYICIKHQSKQQIIYDLYKAVILSHSKALLITLYAFQEKARDKKKCYKQSQIDNIRSYNKQTSDTTARVKEVLRVSSRELWQCDPPQHVKGVTYDKIQEIFQGFFMWQPDTTRGAWTTALTSCASITDHRLRCKSAPCREQPVNRRCTGHLRDCFAIASGMQVCHSPGGSDRRYDWMKTTSDAKYGRYYKHCENTQDFSNIWPFANCFCDCESEDQIADRYFSLRDVLSDVEENKVITGVKLIKDNHVFHIQIQQGTLGSNANITDEPEWKNISGISEKELSSYEISRHYHVNLNEVDRDHEQLYDDWVEFYKNDLVYAITYKQNNIYLDTLDSDSNSLLTGLRFRHVGDSLRLEIQSTPFDFASGRLQTNASSWKFNDNDMFSRQELMLPEPDDPTKWTASEMFSSHNQYVHFGPSDLRRDLSQFTIPFIDIQNVTTNPPMPLSGAGIFHKGSKLSGGFLGLKIVHYDVTNYM